MRLLVLLLSVTSMVLAGCSSSAVVLPSEGSAEPETAPPDTPSTTPYATRTTPRPSRESIAYVALGDSYTVGTSVKAQDRWPNQLVRALRPDVPIELVDNLGVDGYTTADVMAEQLPRLDEVDAGFVSLLIGVNDVVQRVPADEYRDNVRIILDDLLVRLAPERIVVVSTPDYTLTPEGHRYGDPDRQSERIRRFNEIMGQQARDRGLAYVDIGPVADRVARDGSLVARDGLHPSAKQYAAWVEIIAPVVRELLEE